MRYTKPIAAQMTEEMIAALERIAAEMSNDVIICRVSDVVRLACAAYIAAQPAGATGRDVTPTPAAAFVQTFVEPREPFGVI